MVGRANTSVKAVPAFFGLSAAKGRAPMFHHALGERATQGEIASIWVFSAIFFLAAIFAYYKYFRSAKAPRGVIHLTDSSISLPLGLSGKTLTVPYQSIYKLESTSLVRFGGRVINVWHTGGAFMIGESVLVDDDFDKIYARLRLHVPEQ